MLERDLRVDHFNLCQRNSEMIKPSKYYWDIQAESELDRIQTSESLLLPLQVSEMSDLRDLNVNTVEKYIWEIID